jgi:hypothetical protein
MLGSPRADPNPPAPPSAPSADVDCDDVDPLPPRLSAAWLLMPSIRPDDHAGADKPTVNADASKTVCRVFFMCSPFQPIRQIPSLRYVRIISPKQEDRADNGSLDETDVNRRKRMKRIRSAAIPVSELIPRSCA